MFGSIEEMDMIETAIIYIKRNKIKSLIIILIIATIILGEIIGLLLSNASEKSERDAYLYNGAALVIEDDNGGFTKSDYDEIRKVKYVTGLGAWRELIADPVDTENVKEHKGIDPENKDVRNRADKMVIVANMDVQQYSLFSWEKNVSLIEGEFPTYENKGIIVEQRYAKKNNLKVGDEVKYTIGDQSEATSLQICGIYKVDSDFEIYDSNEEGTSVYIHSPYNSIYVDYDYIVELLGLEYTASTGSEVYIDKIEHIDAVKKQLKKMYGDNVEIYDNTSNYLDSECKVVGLMGKTSKIICWMIIIMGEIILLIVFSFYTIQYQKDTGLFMVLGRSRKWCIGRFAFIGMIYAISGLLLGALLYCVLGDLICSIISGIGKNVIINSTDRAIGGYDIPGIFQGFEVRIEMSAFFNKKTY